jgi:hypothetical protein
MNSVKPGVEFSAYKSLENMDHDHDEELGSDHEFEELPDPGETPYFHRNEEIDSDHEFSEQEQEVRFQDEAQPADRQKRKKERYRNRRRADRSSEQQDKGTTLKSVALKKRSKSAAQKIPSASSFQQEFVPSKPAWKGMPDVEKDERYYTLEELVNGFGMNVIDWNGQ